MSGWRASALFSAHDRVSGTHTLDTMSASETSSWLVVQDSVFVDQSVAGEFLYT